MERELLKSSSYTLPTLQQDFSQWKRQWWYNSYTEYIPDRNWIYFTKSHKQFSKYTYNPVQNVHVITINHCDFSFSLTRINTKIERACNSSTLCAPRISHHWYSKNNRNTGWGKSSRVQQLTLRSVWRASEAHKIAFLPFSQLNRR